MKRVIGGTILSIVFAILISSFFPNNDWEGKIATLYTVAGIMFSIGMSIIVTSSFVKIKHKKIRQNIKAAYNSVRNSYILAFLLVSFLYMFQSSDLKPFHIYKFIFFNYTTFLGIVLSFSILFFIINFIDLQKLNNQIDEIIDS